MVDTNSPKFQAKLIALRRKLQESKNKKSKMIASEPRYDDVFWAGVEWLNKL